MTIRSLAMTALAIMAVALPAHAAPQGSWPEGMRGQSLPTQSWIMVIPAVRNDDGSVTLWDRGQEWSRTWTVPRKTPSGTRTVAVNGDSEDMRIVSPVQIDNMSVAALSRLASKYGTQAIAVVVVDGDGDVAVAAWARGSQATWDIAAPTQERRSATDARAVALALFDGIYSGEPSVPAASTPSMAKVAIIGQRKDPATGRTEYRIAGDGEVLEALAASPGFTVTRRTNGLVPSVDIFVVDGTDIEKALADRGFSPR